jgi:putative ABC transport system ATP-binding protein
VALLTANSVVLTCSNVVKTYFDAGQPVEVLKGLDFEVRSGEMVAVVGASGSGKTTLINLIACLDKSTSGEIILDGKPLKGLGDNELSLLRRNKVGIVFQGFYLLDILNARENVEVPMVFANVPQKARTKRALELLDMVGMRDSAEHYPNEMSGGQMQRVAVARALANDPKVLLADEPTGNLDTATGVEIIRLFQELAHQYRKAVIVATHDPEAASAADRILVLQYGKLHTDTSMYGRDTEAKKRPVRGKLKK